MNKPSLFIGSSVEGLNIAYAIQDNLKFTAETTVWDQGIFNLSESSLESLLTLLDNCDFGAFVFTPDDYVNIRGKKNLAVRDNVLFELGLFIGRLGRQRCFIIIPENKEFHLPTDLIGITPAKYETDRTDKNIQAATGSASNKIRERISKLGTITKSEEDPDTKALDTVKVESNNDSESWFDLLYVKKDYEGAIRALKKKINLEKKSEKKILLKGHICTAEYKKDSQKGKDEFEKFINEHKKNNTGYISYAKLLISINAYLKAIEIIDAGLANCEKKITLTQLKADCLWETNQKEKSILFLKEFLENTKNQEIYVKLASQYVLAEEKKNALEILYQGFIEHPSNETILNQFASVANDLGHKDVCVLLYKELLKNFPYNARYWCLLGNAYYELSYFNMALTTYEKANELSNGKEGWILANIANLYSSKNLYDKSETYLLLAQNLDDKSEYTHSRLSHVYLSKQTEEKNLIETLKSAKEKLNGSILN